MFVCLFAVQQIVECIVNQGNLHEYMIGRKKAVKQRYMELQQQLDERQKLSEQLRLELPKHVQQYTTFSFSLSFLLS